jgi:predicted transcriptional regulator
MNGWIKLHRKIKDSPVYKEGLILLFLECVLSATHKDRKIDHDGVEIILKPGQFVFGRHEWAKRLGMNRSTLYKRIKKLEKLGIIVEQSWNRVGTELEQKSSSHGGSLYQIQNWEKYQSEEQPSSSEVAAREQRGNTNKNDKKERIKEERETAPSKYSSVSSIDKEVLKQVSDDLMVEYWFVEQKWESLKDWLVAKGKVYKDYKALLRNAVRKDAEDKHKKKTKTAVISSDWDELARKAGYKL